MVKVGIYGGIYVLWRVGICNFTRVDLKQHENHLCHSSVIHLNRVTNALQAPKSVADENYKPKLTINYKSCIQRSFF